MTRQCPHIMVLTGEPSGDFHAGPLIKALKQLRPGSRFSGIGGPAMKTQGADVFFPIEKLSAMGLIQVIRQFSTIKQAFRLVKHQIRTHKPDLVVLIDYPGFNLRVARYIKENTNIPVCYYIAPKVWAWNRARLKKIKQYTDHVALILPFEQQIYKKEGIPATYVGNPLVDEYPCLLPGPPEEQQGPGRSTSATGIPAAPVIGLLPGSRSSEVTQLMPVMLEATEKILVRHPRAKFLISAASDIQEQKIRETLSRYGNTRHCIVKGRPLSIFRRAHMLIAASGTVTLEAALCGLPTIIVYKVSPLTFALGKRLVRVSFVGLANLIADRQVMPELLQTDASPDRISDTALSMLESLDMHRRQLAQVRGILGSPGAPARTARIILSLIGTGRS